MGACVALYRCYDQGSLLLPMTWMHYFAHLIQPCAKYGGGIDDEGHLGQRVRGCPAETRILQQERSCGLYG